MGTVLSLEDYLKRIKYPENITLLQDFKRGKTQKRSTHLKDAIVRCVIV